MSQNNTIMELEKTKMTVVVNTSKEMNRFLMEGWTLIQTYVMDSGNPEGRFETPNFVLAWQKDSEPSYPEEEQLHWLNR
jgi:hypothetical protein